MSLKGLGVVVWLALLPVAGASATELVTDGGFEAGDLGAWSLTDSSGFSGLTTPGHSGSYAAALGAEQTDGTLGQVLSTVNGQSYSLTFWLANNSDTPTTNFEVSVGGVVLDSLSNSAVFDFQQFTYNFIASGANTQLLFTARNDDGFWFLDDVSVTESRDTNPAPEPMTLSLLGAGLAGFGAMRRMRK
jgi:hypothetical protein